MRGILVVFAFVVLGAATAVACDTTCAPPIATPVTTGAPKLAVPATTCAPQVVCVPVTVCSVSVCDLRAVRRAEREARREVRRAARLAAKCCATVAVVAVEPVCCVAPAKREEVVLGSRSLRGCGLLRPVVGVLQAVMPPYRGGCF
jgi:hypothetical protein